MFMYVCMHTHEEWLSRHKITKLTHILIQKASLNKYKALKCIVELSLKQQQKTNMVWNFPYILVSAVIS